jgi:hypothetical protein
MESNDYKELLEEAGEAYALLKQTGLSKPLKDAATKFTKWFGSLFTRKYHKEKIVLLENLKIKGEEMNALKIELEVMASENESLKQEMIQKLKEYNDVKTNSENSSNIKLAHSTMKNIVNAPITNVSGNISIGDKYSK